MNKKLIYSIFLIAAVFAVFFFSFNQRTSIKFDKPVMVLNNLSILVDQAITAEEQAQGLSGRTSLGENQGMLFPFATSGKHYFWMKDMNFPIDMIFLDSDLKVVYIKKNALPESYPDAFGGEVDSKYVLEVASGIADKASLKIGDKLQLQLPM
jgi:uncharacterized membrane protein (UPF0127 family)